MKSMSGPERKLVNKTIKRDIHQIFSKGTHFKMDAD